MIMEAEKSHHLLSANWRPRRPGGVTPEGLRTKGAEDRDDVPDRAVRREGLQFSLPPPFCSIQASLNGLDEAHHIRRGNLLY